jgi:hypothetical protein
MSLRPALDDRNQVATWLLRGVGVRARRRSTELETVAGVEFVHLVAFVKS